MSNKKTHRSNKSVRAFVKDAPSAVAMTDPFVPMGGFASGDLRFWRWGDDNVFPYALALLYRCSTAHRRVINDKADYITGRGFTCDENNAILSDIIKKANGQNQTLRQVLNNVAKDKCLFGNAFIEIITDGKGSFVSFHHQDASKCRLSKDKKKIILHHNWCQFSENKAQTLPIYPAFDKKEDGLNHSIIHYKDYEPMFENYGVPPYIAGLGVSSIAYKTDKWNISRLDNSFQLSGVMVLDATADNEEEAERIVKAAEEKFAGKPGQVMFLVKNNTDGNENTKYVPIQSSNEGDWDKLHDQATSDIVIAHSWFRSLSGLDYATGLTSDKILNEYQIALNTIIQPEQTELMEPIRSIIQSTLNIDASSLQIVNRPPITEKPDYLKIWEARKIDGLDYDEADPSQQEYLANLKKSSTQ